MGGGGSLVALYPLTAATAEAPEARPLVAIFRRGLDPGEGQEHLLQGRLVHAVVLHVQLALGPLHDVEDVGQAHVGVGHLHVSVALVGVEELGAGKALLDVGHQGLDGGRAASDAAVVAGHLDLQGVALAELGLEVLRAAQADEAAVDHDGDAGAQRFTLLHAASRK